MRGFDAYSCPANIMFSYYGSKSKCLDFYPAPTHDLIIEPFAGSARYALKYFDREVILADTSEYVYEVWRYLINASEKDVSSLPDVPSHVNIEEFEDTKNLSNAEKWLIGFSLCRGKAKPRKVGHAQNSWNKDKVRIATNLYKIRHWVVCNQSYLNLPNVEATWFIDPPYKEHAVKTNSSKYPHYQIDYEELAEFAKTRKGQVIVCEGSQAGYLPFELAGYSSGTARKNPEYVYVGGD